MGSIIVYLNLSLSCQFTITMEIISFNALLSEL